MLVLHNLHLDMITLRPKENTITHCDSAYSNSHFINEFYLVINWSTSHEKELYIPKHLPSS